MSDIGKRKDEHLEINISRDVRSNVSTGFDSFVFTHQALPEINLTDVQTQTSFLGRKLALPLLISSMTGGTEKSDGINLRLAEAANETGIAMGVGSQRADIVNLKKRQGLPIRQTAPDIPIYANLGAVQLNYGFSLQECQRAVELVEADALILHLNPLQEALQPEGQTNFSSLLSKIEVICQQINLPVIVKEVGWGISQKTARKLIEVGVAAIDVAGAGGTSWSEVEKHRSTSDQQYRLAGLFRDWGIPTTEALIDVHTAFPTIPKIASGGISNGLEIAKSIALGANLTGIARPFLIAANESSEAVVKLIKEIQTELRVTMFAVGALTVEELGNVELKRRFYP